MDSSLRARFAQAADDLQHWYAQLNRAYNEAEEMLCQMHLPHDVHTPMPERQASQEPGAPMYGPGDEEIILKRALCAVKDHTNSGKKVRIYYTTEGRDFDPDYTGAKPVLECSLDIRKEALAYLPKLFEAAVATIEQEAAELEGVLGAAREAIAPFKVQ